MQCFLKIAKTCRHPAHANIFGTRSESTVGWKETEWLQLYLQSFLTTSELKLISNKGTHHQPRQWSISPQSFSKLRRTTLNSILCRRGVNLGIKRCNVLFILSSTFVFTFIVFTIFSQPDPVFWPSFSHWKLSTFVSFYSSDWAFQSISSSQNHFSVVVLMHCISLTHSLSWHSESKLTRDHGKTCYTWIVVTVTTSVILVQ